MGKLWKWLLWAQGILYVGTGIWPLLHMPSFLAVTGPKNEVWLVVAVGVLVLAVGVALLISALQGKREVSIGVLAFLCAAGLATVDIRYATHDVIKDIYLLDAAAEIILALGWMWALLRRNTSTSDLK